MLADAQDIETVKAAVNQLGNIVQDMIKFSLGDAAYDRAAEALEVMRTECTELEEPAVYNDFVRNLKESLLRDVLGGDRREMWWKMKKAKLGLIDKKTSEASDVSEEDAQTVSLTFDDEDEASTNMSVVPVVEGSMSCSRSCAHIGTCSKKAKLSTNGVAE